MDDFTKNLGKFRKKKKTAKRQFEGNLKLNSQNLKDKLMEKLRSSDFSKLSTKRSDSNENKKLYLKNLSFNNYRKVQTDRRNLARRTNMGIDFMKIN